MKLIDWQTYAIGRVANREHERPGQALYNALREKRPDLEARIWQTEYDTFNNDEAMPDLFNWVALHWDTT